MANHRDLSMKTFVQSIQPDVFQRYFERLPPSQQPSSPWVYLNPDAMQEYLSNLNEADADATIMEDFRCINDISALGTNLLIRAYNRVGGSFDPEQTTQELAMGLFLDYPEAFQYAWSRYLLYSTNSKLSSYPLMVPQLDVTEERIGKLQDDLSNWLASQAKGKDCNVSWHQDDNQSTLYVQRGAHRRTMPYWKDGKIEIASLRLASEDLLVYNPKQASLTIKAGLVKDNEFYLSIFAYHVAGDGSLARKALDTPMFSLEPLERGTFDYTGNGIITGIDLTWAKIRLYDIHSSVIEIKSKSVLGTLEHGLHRSPLRQGKLVSVRFRFQIHPDEGRPATVSFEVQPPVRTNLTQKRYADIIEDYLREQGVMLR